MEKIIKRVIICALILLVLMPVFLEIAENSSFKSIKFKDYEKVVEKTSNYKFALIYVAPKTSTNLKDTKKEIAKDLDGIKDKDVKAKAYFLDYESLSAKQIKKLGIEDGNYIAYLFVNNGEIIKTYSGSLENSKLKNYITMYTAGGIDKDLVKYKTAKSAESYLKKVASDNVTVAVFGRNNCYYCNQFLPIVNTVAEEKDVSIYYFDSNTYDKDEYQKVMDAKLTILKECTGDEKESTLDKGFGTPLTIITKSNKTIDCISGYTSKSSLITKLKTVGLIEK